MGTDEEEIRGSGAKAKSLGQKAGRSPDGWVPTKKLGARQEAGAGSSPRGWKLASIDKTEKEKKPIEKCFSLCAPAAQEGEEQADEAKPRVRLHPNAPASRVAISKAGEEGTENQPADRDTANNARRRGPTPSPQASPLEGQSNARRRASSAAGELEAHAQQESQAGNQREAVTAEAPTGEAADAATAEETVAEPV